LRQRHGLGEGNEDRARRRGVRHRQRLDVVDGGGGLDEKGSHRDDEVGLERVFLLDEDRVSDARLENAERRAERRLIHGHEVPLPASAGVR
jgi:hypothetical protein